MKAPISKNYSRYVNLMKVTLPVGIILSVAFAFSWPYLQTIKTEEVATVDTSKPEISENRMIRPHYLSTDEKGQPFEVDAEWAKNKSEHETELFNPEGSLTVFEGEAYKLTAKEGHYNKEKQTLDLFQDVNLKSSDGYEVRTQEAHVNINNKTVEGNVYIEGEGPGGAIMGSNGFIIENRPKGKKIITLKGPSRVVINDSALKKKKESHAQ